MQVTVNLKVNKRKHELTFDSHFTLLEVLRERLELTSVHRSCEEGECGACTVLVDGDPVSSCLVLAASLEGAEILTTEGLKKGDNLHPLMESFLTNHGLQCGFCTPGVLMTAYSIIEKADGKHLDDARIRHEIEGNLCRCTGYINIVKSIQAAAKERQAGNWW